MFAAAIFTIFLVPLTAEQLPRQKRQLGFYNCGSWPNNYISNSPCPSYNWNTNTNCLFGNTNCNNNNYNSYSGTVGVLSSNSASQCYSGCGGINCNAFNGNYVNGQYQAYVIGTNQYSACGSRCCGGNNGYSTGGIVIGGGLGISGIGGLNGGIQNALLNLLPGGNGLCGGIEQPTGSCPNGQCSDGMHCVRGHICCACFVGASNGRCSGAGDCPAGYTCAQNGHCCASSPFAGLTHRQCVNDACDAGYRCGIGNLCYKI